MSKQIVDSMGSNMDKSIQSLKGELAKVRTGRASTALVEPVHVDYYGSSVPINQVANVTTPDARTIQISPWEGGMIGAIEKAILAANIGLTPQNDGKVIRIPLPAMTEERRKELIKVARHKAEEGRVSIRNIRRHAKETLDKLARDGEVGEDDVTRAEKELEKVTHKYVEHADEALKHKEAELLEV